jgi:nicotinate-nucleotide adenylyltransferase
VRPGWKRAEWDKLLTPLTGDQLARLQAGVVETPMIEISSSDIRRRVGRGQSIRYLVPERVRAYLDAHQLYR